MSVSGRSPLPVVCPSCTSRSRPAHWEHLGVSWGACWKEGTPTGDVFRPGHTRSPAGGPQHQPCPSLRSCGSKGRSAALTASATGPRGPSGQMTRVPRPPRGPPPGPGRPVALGSRWGLAVLICTCCFHCAPGSVFGRISLQTDESGKQQGLELEGRPAGPGQVVAEASRLPGAVPSASQVAT